MELTNIKRITMVMLATLILCFSVGAQVLNEGDLLKNPPELLNSNQLSNGNDAFIQQLGNENHLDLLQIQQGAEGNLAKVLQSGQHNRAIISQMGQGNQLALIQQGDLNSYELRNAGSNNQVVAIQQGDGNIIHQEIIESHHIYSEMIQIGNQNEIITVLEGVNNTSFKIRQVGNGLTAIIRESGN